MEKLFDKGGFIYLQNKKDTFIWPLENQSWITIALTKFWRLFQKNWKKENLSLRVTNLSILDL